MKEDCEKIQKYLKENKIEFTLFTHPPVFTSEEAAKIRGISLKSGAKSMIVRSNGKFYNFILSAEKKIDWEKVKIILNTKSVSFATPEEVKKVTNCEVGSVPPFGNLYNLKTYCDPSLLENESIDFNAGLHEVSIKMKCKDWVTLVQPEIITFTKE